MEAGEQAVALAMEPAATTALTVLSAVLPALAGAACVLAVYRKAGRERWAWGFLALSCLTWGAFSALNAFADALPPMVLPLPELRFMASVLLAAVGMALLSSAPSPASQRLQSLLDGAIVASSLLFVSWATVLAPAYRADSVALTLRLVNLAHPLGDLVMATTVIFLLYRAWRARRLSWLYLAVGILVNAITDSGLSWIQLRSINSQLGDLLTWGWLVGFTLIGSSAVLEKRGQPISAMARFPIAATAFLKVPPVAVGILAAIKELASGGLEPFLFWNAFAVVGLVIVRELITVIENRTLIRTMETRIATRTEALSKSEAKLSTLLRTSPDAIILTDADGKIAYGNPVLERVLGRPPEAEVGRSWYELIHPDDQPRLQWAIDRARQTTGGRVTSEARVSHADQGWRQAEITITNLLEEAAVTGLVVNIRDITERKALDDQLIRRALHDDATGLPNRAVFRDRLHQSVVRAARRREQPAVLLVRLDEPHDSGNGHDHPAAGGLLAMAGDRIQQSVRAGDTVARLAADTFAVLLEDTHNDDSPAQVAQRIMAELEALSVSGQAASVTASVGIASLIPGSRNPDDVLRNADTALFEAQAAGKGRIAVYDGSRPKAPASSQLELQAELQRAIERKEFVCHYQPIVRLDDGRPVAVEALVRWVHPWRGVLPPGDFIFAADKTGAIVSLGRWILLEGARLVRRWQEQLDLPTLGLAVNLSLRQLNDDGLRGDILEVLEATGLEPSLLMLELREHALLEDLSRSVDRLQGLKSLGVNLAIDDFTSDGSSLTYLRQLPIDTLKIDRSFVLTLGKQRETAHVRAILTLAEALKAEVVAEGIEEPHQAGALLELGCRLGQGFYYAKPLAGPQMFDYLQRQAGQAAA